MNVQSDRPPMAACERRRRLLLRVFGPLSAALLAVAMPFAAQSPNQVPDRFTRVFNGKDLSGWHPSLVLPTTARRRRSP